MDRNPALGWRLTACLMSLSARRAWIEIRRAIRPATGRPVALRKESVDRNVVGDVMGKALAESLSARRAWIEISVTRYKPTPKPGRSPQGERG